MAIAFDAAGLGALNSPTWNHIMGASGKGLMVSVTNTGSAGDTSAVAWNTSESLTKIGEIQAPGDLWISLWYLLNPTTGTHVVTITTIAGVFVGASISLTASSLAFDTSATGAGTTSASSIMTVASNAWIVSGFRTLDTFGITWTNATKRAGATNESLGFSMADSNGPLSGSQTTTATVGSANPCAIVSGSFVESGGGASPLRRNSSLSGLGASGPFFHDVLSKPDTMRAERMAA